MEKSQAIGIFDSGIGGLTVARSLENALPHEQFIYFGDTAHMPYGDKNADEILQYSRKIVQFLISKQVKLIVIACNSASAMAASKLRSEFWQQVEIIGVIRPVVKSIIKKNIHNLGIIATKATVESGIYKSIITEYNADIEVYEKATPLLAPMIESGIKDTEEMKNVLNEYLKDKNFDDKEGLLLACTHYPLIKEQVDSFFEYKKIIFDNATPLAEEVKRYLSEKNLLAEIKTGENQFFVSKFSNTFEKTARTFYNKDIHIQEYTL